MIVPKIWPIQALIILDECAACYFPHNRAFDTISPYHSSIFLSVTMIERFGNFGVELVWNKGIAALCDRRIPDEFPDRRNYSLVPTFAGAMLSSRVPDNLIANPESYGDIEDGELVWVRVSWLRSFIKQVLPLVRTRFVLVTGDSDACVPAELGAEGRTLLESPKIIHWYTQNYDGSVVSDKVSPIPIGIPFNTLHEGPRWGETACAPEEQEAILNALAAEFRPREERIQQVYVDFAWQRSWGIRAYRRYHRIVGTWCRQNRRSVTNSLKGCGPVFFQDRPLPRTEMWRARGKYAFVVSPHGTGLDCHRSWEALVLGHIVLVPSSSLDGLYAGLSVVPLKSWKEITPDNLRKWLQRFPETSGLHEKLRSSYWVSRMRGAVETEKNRQSLLRGSNGSE